MLNYMMVRDGYAVIYTVPPNVKYAEWLLQAQRLAREEKKRNMGQRWTHRGSFRVEEEASKRLNYESRLFLNRF